MASFILVSSTSYAAPEIKVVATIKPVHSLAARLLKGIGEPQLLVQGAASPHTYSLKPSDAKALNHADVFFRVSEQIEPFTIKLMKSLPKSVEAVTLADAPGIERLDKRTGGTFDAHEHGKSEKGHKHGHDHDEEETGGTDGHVWLDPDNARGMAAEMAKVLSKRAPAHAAAIAANARALDADLAALTSEIDAALAPVKSRPFVVFHDAYQYFERRFGLQAAGSVTVSPEVQPSAKRLSAVRAKISKLGAACVFAEPQFSAKLINAVSEGTGARAGSLDPEGASLEPGPDAYFSLLRNLAASLKGCLAQGS